MAILSIDFETRSTVDLKTTGVYPYAEHETTDVWCMAYAFDDEEPELWLPGAPLPPRVRGHVTGGGEVRAWNAQFERIIWNVTCSRRYQWPRLKIEQVVDTAVEAATMGLPRSLDGCAQALKVPHQKDKAGHALMMRLCRPRRVEADGTVIWWTDLGRFERLYEYCRQDVRAERDIMHRLVRQTPTERALYELDQRMNDMGVGLDRELVRAATGISLEGIRRANAEIKDLTAGKVETITQNGRLLSYLRGSGLVVDSVDKASVRELLASDLPETLRRVLTLRAEAGRSSVAKLQAMEDCVCADDRIRGLLFFYGASTGRWSGRLVQPQNFPRGDVDHPEQYLDTVLAGDYDLLDLQTPPLAVVSSLLRACLVPDPGARFLAADYSAIEARVLNWLAGQDDYVRMFASGQDVYKVNATKLYGIPLEAVQKFPHRQTGKFQELGCGYGMGAKKAVSAAKDVYGLELSPETAQEIVTAYRESHPAVVEFWYATEAACLRAVREPGTRVAFGADDRLSALARGGYLAIRLPSGRSLFYPGVDIVRAETPWSREARELAIAEGKEPPTPKLKDALEFSSVNTHTKQWGRERTYGGKLVENIVQAVSRDIMAEAMLRADEAGYPPVLTVHDEIVAEVPEGFGTLAEFEALLATPPAWARSCPITVEGWEGRRYRK